MNDTLVTVVAIFLVVALLIVVPLQVISQRTDTISQLDVDDLTSKFVDQIRSEGAVTKTNYYNFKQSLASTGNTYDVNMEFKILDENPGKKTTQTERDKIGENVYYSIYTSQIEDALENSETEKYSLHEGDFVSVTVRNTNLTIGQQIKNFAYKITGNDTYTISASKSGLVLANGATSTVIGDDVDKPEIEIVLKENDANGKVITKQNSNSTEVTNYWTNKNVYVELSSKDNYNLDLIYFSRKKINSQDYYNYTKLPGNNFVETIAGENVYQVFWKTSLLEKYSDIKDVRIRIDRTAPVIKQVIATTEKGNTGKITVNAEDQGGSGIGGYFYKWSQEGQNPSQPDINDSGWVNSNSIIAYPENYNQKCTVWVKDNAGNISKSGSAVVRNVVSPITGVTLNGTIVKTGEEKTINATLTGGTDYKDIKFDIADASIATISGNGTEAKVTGKTPGKTTATCTVTNYDGTTQTANAIITVTNIEFSPNGGTYKLAYVDQTYKVTIKTRVTLGGNPNKTEYAMSNSNSQAPSNWTKFNSGDEVQNTVFNAGYYYLWIKASDEYGNSVLYTSNLFKLEPKIPSAPTIKYNSGSNECKWENNINITLSVPDSQDDIDHYEIDWTGDGNANTTTGANFIPWNGYSSCNNRFRAVNKAGYKSNWSSPVHIHMDTEKPAFTSWWYDYYDTDSIVIRISASDNASGISRVALPTSTEAGGYGNWAWADASWDASQRNYVININPRSWSHWNTHYVTHLYMWDNAGNGGYYAQSSFIWIGNPIALYNESGRYYSSIGKAINAIGSSGNITMVNSTTESPEIPGGKNIAINLNTKTVTGSVSNNGTLTIWNGTVQNGYGALINRGNLVVNGGTYAGQTWGVATLSGNVTIYSGNFSGSSQGIWQQNGRTAIFGGSFVGGIFDGISIDNGRVDISGGYFNGNNSGAYVHGGSMYISGGTFIGNLYDGISVYGYVQISGGYFQGYNWGCYQGGGTFMWKDGYNLYSNFKGRLANGFGISIYFTNGGAY